MSSNLWSRAVLVAAVVLLGVAMAAAWSRAGGREAREGEGDAAPAHEGAFALLELFTSEGCSSCPPADEVLADIAAETRATSRPVFALSFHVDYWDRLGWADPYSDAAHSRRQSRYAAAFGGDDVYTPQMVVNGTTGFVGSDRARAAAEIDGALRRAPACRITLRPSRRQSELSVAYDVTPVPANAVVNVAVVERGLTNKVGHGENGGRTLRHENVVRAFASHAVAEGGRGTVEVSMPAGVKAENVSLVAYAQDGKTMKVLGAAGADLPADQPGAATEGGESRRE